MGDGICSNSPCSTVRGDQTSHRDRRVTTFYGQVRQDPLIGLIFEAKICNWNHHLEKLCAFWSSVVLMTGRYHGQPMQAHMSLPVESKHFERWLEIFEATASDICPPEAAEVFIDRARRTRQCEERGPGNACPDHPLRHTILRCWTGFRRTVVHSIVGDAGRVNSGVPQWNTPEGRGRICAPPCSRWHL